MQGLTLRLCGWTWEDGDGLSICHGEEGHAVGPLPQGGLSDE